MISLNKDFNNNSRAILKNAILLAAGSEKKIMEPKHIFIAMLSQKGSIAGNMLNEFSIEPETGAKDKKRGKTSLSLVNISDEVKRSLEKAIMIAAIYKHKYIGTEHLLAGILELDNPYIKALIKKAKIDINYLKEKLKVIFENTANFPALYPYDFENFPEMPLPGKKSHIQTAKKNRKHLYLNNYCADLTDLNFQKNIDPVIGREKEIKRLIQILSRRNKNNPILIGEAGVGKTAIVEGLAKKISSGEIAEPLLDKKILSLDINSLVAGTSFRGEFEARLKNLIKELSHNTNIIIFIDEIHNIIGAGSTSGALDAANILKPFLTKGNIKFIGATTFSEYKKHIEKDPAFERRFQPIIVAEPTLGHTIKILEGIKKNYEKFHNLNITSEAIETSVKLSQRYISDRLLPDKAIDLLDEAASKYKLEKNNTGIAAKIKNLEKHLFEIIEQKEDNVLNENFDMALKCKNEETKIIAEIKKLQENIKNLKKFGSLKSKNIYEAISEITNIPEKNIDNNDISENISNLSTKLKNKIAAQDEAIGKIVNTLKRSFAGISIPSKPLGSFLFVGPSGVGKTELAKTLAESLFNSKKSLIKIDMSEYAESFNISKLIGSPAGYVGFDKGGILTEKIRKNPHSIILFDELEKGHKSLFNLLLQILEDGEITDASGRVINFKNAIIIMASNAGISNLGKKSNLGFSLDGANEKENLKNQAITEAKKLFPDEFLNRIDNTIFFNPLSRQDIEKIVSLNLNELAERIEQTNKINISFDKKVLDYLTKKSFCENQGARLVKKAIQDAIEDLLAEKIIEKEVKQGDNIKIKASADKINIQK